MKRIIMNLGIFKNIIVKTLATLFSVSSAILLFVDKKDLGIDSTCKGIFTLCGIGVFAVIVGCFFVYNYRKKIVFENVQGKLTVRYDDIFKFAFPKWYSKHKKNKRIVVIGVNTSFDTIVDEDVQSISKPLVSINTLHGKWLQKMQEHGINGEDIDAMIKNNFQIHGILPSKTLSIAQKQRGNLDGYDRGTIATVEHDNTIFYLIALSEFDENNNAQNTRKELTNTIEKLITYYDQKGQGYNIYIPLLGTGMSRTNISAEEALDTMVSEIKINRSKIHGQITVVVNENNRDKISIDV